jgi:hypothetical protein
MRSVVAIAAFAPGWAAVLSDAAHGNVRGGVRNWSELTTPGAGMLPTGAKSRSDGDNLHRRTAWSHEPAREGGRFVSRYFPDENAHGGCVLTAGEQVRVPKTCEARYPPRILRGTIRRVDAVREQVRKDRLFLLCRPE